MFDSSSGCVAGSIHTLPHVEQFDVVRPERLSLSKVQPFTTGILQLQQQEMPKKTTTSLILRFLEKQQWSCAVYVWINISILCRYCLIKVHKAMKCILIDLHTNYSLEGKITLLIWKRTGECCIFGCIIFHLKFLSKMSVHFILMFNSMKYTIVL